MMSLEAEVIELRELLKRQALVIKDLQARILYLEEQLKMNSRNSSKPPSSDRFKHNLKPKPKSEKKVGGQEGHQGSNLPLSDSPDEILTFRAVSCSGCGTDLREVTSTKVIRRQELDLPEPRPLIVKEYRSEVVDCPACGKQNAGIFPEHLKAVVQYGPHLRAVLMLLVHRHGIPYKRVAELMQELFNVNISPGTVVNATKKLAGEAQKSLKIIENRLKTEPVVHLDETGLRTAGKTMWVHAMCSARDTHLLISEKRGFEAIQVHLEGYEGTAIHDGWKSYQKFDCKHGLCNAHHLRELRFLYEIQGHLWATEYADLLMSAYRQTKEGGIALENQAKIREQAQTILDRAKAEHPPPEPAPVGHRGRIRKPKALNLIERLERFAEQVWLFITDPKIPFDNNPAERDIRMLKVMQKVKGCFRTLEGAAQHLTIRSLILSTQKKQQNILQILTQLLQPAS